MFIFIGYIVFCVIVGSIGSNRKIGFGGAFVLSLLLSPIIGLIITLLSKDKQDEALKMRMHTAQLKQQAKINKIEKAIDNSKEVVKPEIVNETAKPSLMIEELEKLNDMLEKGLLTESEHKKAVAKLVS